VLVSELGANVYAKNKYGNTAAHYASMMNHSRLLEVLYDELGADITAQNNIGMYALNLGECHFK
jgi:ankyrin repeat protein